MKLEMNTKENFNFEQDKELYPNRKSKGVKSAKYDDYQDTVCRYKYDTTAERRARYTRREIFANKREEIVFNTPRTEEDLDIASKVEMDDKDLSKKVWRHPDFFGLEGSPKGLSKTPRSDFFSKHRSSVRKSLKDHLLSSNTRCFRNGFYREHNIPYDFYWNKVTGHIVLVKSETQKVFSFWNISRMQRLELLNHNHIHKHWRLIDQINEIRLQLEEQAKAEAQQTLEEE
jgi:hypothetical protein